LTAPRPPAPEFTWSTALVVVPGDGKAALPLARVRRSKAAWVVIRCAGGRHLYAFSRNEVLAMVEALPAGTDLRRITLAQALDLRQEHQTTAITGPFQPPPAAIGDAPSHEACLPSGSRQVLVDASGRPLAVGGAPPTDPPPAAQDQQGMFGNAARIETMDERDGPAPFGQPSTAAEEPPSSAHGAMPGAARGRRPSMTEFLAAFQRAGYRGDFVSVPEIEPASSQDFDRLVEDAVNRVLERRGAAGLPAPPPAATPAQALGVPAGDEAVTPVRLPSIEAEKPPASGCPIVLVVDLLHHPAAAASGGPEQQLGSPAPEWAEIALSVTLSCPVIDFEDAGTGGTGATGSVTIRCNAASLPARITGRVRAGLQPGARLDVTALFHHGTRFCGNALRQIRLAAAPAAPASPLTPQPLASPPSPFPAALVTVGVVAVDVAAEPPDLTIHVLRPEPASPGKLRWILKTAQRLPGLPAEPSQAVDLGIDTATYAQNLFAAFAALDPGNHRSRIDALGDQLWQTVPAAAQAAYWAMWDRHRRPLTIQFVSDEPHLPWELARPSRNGESHPPLALQHPVARWIARWDGLLRNRLPSGGVVTLAPHCAGPGPGPGPGLSPGPHPDPGSYPGPAPEPDAGSNSGPGSGPARLPRALQESAALVAHLHAASVPATRTGVRELLECAAPRDPVAILHVAAQGTLDAAAANTPVIELEDGELTLADVARRQVQLGIACGTLVFFNVRHAGPPTGALSGTAGRWADAFLGRHFGGFIAPLWAGDDQHADVVSIQLLKGILAAQEPIGAVLCAIRKAYGDSSPTFASYLYYGDVTARIVPDDNPVRRATPPAPASRTASARRPAVPRPELPPGGKGLVLEPH
jgi:hypothetical protein